MADGDLTTTAKVKTYMGISSASLDARIDALVPAVSAEIARYCDRTFTPVTTHKGKVWSLGGKILYLPNYPVVELRRVLVDDKYVMKITNTSADATGATVQIDDTNFFLNVYGGANAGHISSVVLAAQTLAQIKTTIEALAKGWSVTIVSGSTLYPATELLQFGGRDALYPIEPDCYIPWDLMDDLEVEQATGRAEAKIGAFPRSKFVFVEYTAGYAADAIPADLEMLANKVITFVLQQSSTDQSKKSEKWPDYGYTNESGMAKMALANFEDELSSWKRWSL